MHFSTPARILRSCLPLFAASAVFVSVPTAHAEPDDFSAWTLSLSPTFSMPLSSGDFKPNELFASAWGGSVGAEYQLSSYMTSSLPLSLRLGMAYSSGGLLPSGGIEVPGASTSLSLAPRLRLLGFMDAGLSIGKLSTGTSSTYGATRVGGGLGFSVMDSLDARLDASLLYKFGLYGGLGVSLGVGYRLPEASSSGGLKLLELGALKLDNVFPIFRSYYDDNPVGTVTVANSGKKAATNVRVSFLIRQYMDGAKECAVIPRIEPGKSVTIPLYGLFNDSILSVTEATKVTAAVSVEYGGGTILNRTATVLVYDRNALTWKDDRHAVSSKDPWVLDLSGNIVSAVKGSRNPEVPANLQTGVAFHEGLRAYGIAYVLSPSRPFAQAIVDTAAIDSLKFPRQTLGYRAGDCADLSVLYASLFEAAGIETAFVTVPGHIFMAFNLGITSDEAKAQAIDEREFIVAGGKLWIPVETTMRDSGFLEVWRKAASQWRTATARGEAGFFPVHEAWRTFAPVGLPADGSNVVAPAADKVAAGFEPELAKVVKLGMNARLTRLGPLPASGTAKYLNDRGVIYAKYGMFAEAERDLKKAAADQFAPAVINLGNVAFMKSDYRAAYDYFSRAAKLSPDNPRLLVSLATAAASMGRTDEVIATLERVSKLDQKIAERYASLVQSSSSATRAAEAGKGEIIWF
jgi:tetratricopeptide (TPR) repeat protein